MKTTGSDSRDPQTPTDSAQPDTWRERFLERFDQVRFFLYSTLIVFLFLVGFLWKKVLVVIPAGHRGVMFHHLGGGTDTSRIWSEGLHLILPWNTLVSYDTRLQGRTLQFKVLSEEGLEMGVSVSIRFRPEIESLGYLHQDIGPDYFDRLVVPEVQGHLRRTFGARRAHEIYTSARDVLQEVARVPLLGRRVKSSDPQAEPLVKPYVRLEELRILDFIRPAVIVDAINEKQRQEQRLLEYKYRLQTEEQEAERKRTEAAGIRDYNLVAGKLSTALLHWRAIEVESERVKANADLAKSNNSKIVVLGNGQAGLPLSLQLGEPPLTGLTPPADGATAPPSAPAPPNKGKAKEKPTTPPGQPAPNTER
jgi:regulator of protease activity HflC (stomatin/prohibitin superfamily)